MEARRRDLGSVGEELAARSLTDQGMTILARNWRNRLGELDIVALQGDTLVFAEVKTRRRASFASPEIGVFGNKRQRLRLLAGSFIAARRPTFVNCRFDVIAVTLEPVTQVVQIPDAF